jgi:ABC-type polysaccharide/polyol phosphate transport system ATPase subunit
MTAPPPLLAVHEVAKAYRLWQKPSDRLTMPLVARAAALPGVPSSWRTRAERMVARRAREFQALQPVTFKIGRGESLGIIGRNGAGKSTLLQIIAGTLAPTSGSVERHGRVAALLELGSGFNFEFTGRENVLLNAALQGVPRAEAEAALAAVEAFAAIGDFIDQPVKTYSSGMMVRLAFAAQTIVDPELFIVDEALAVGDVFFQAQCARFFKERLAAGMSLLLVSHDLPSVKALCRHAIVLHEGRAVFHGPSAEAVSVFHALHSSPEHPRPASSSPATAAAAVDALPAAERRQWRAGTSESGSRQAEIVGLKLLDASGRPAGVFGVGERIVCDCWIEAHESLAELQFSFEVSTRHNQVVFGVSSTHLEVPTSTIAPGECLRVRFEWSAHLGVGEYLVDLGVGLGDRGDGAPRALLHRLGHVASFTVHHGPFKPRFFGVSDLEPSIQINPS